MQYAASKDSMKKTLTGKYIFFSVLAVSQTFIHRYIKGP